MSWQEFVVSLLEAVAWPLVAVILTLLVIPEIKRLIPLLSKIRYGGLEMEFGQRLAETVEIARELPPAAEVEEPSSSRDLVAVSPRGAILESWIELESITTNMLPDSDRRNPPHSRLRQLHETGALSSNEFAVLEELRRMRNQAVHRHDFDTEVGTDTARVYVDLAQKLKRVLLSKQQPPADR